MRSMIPGQPILLSSMYSILLPCLPPQVIKLTGNILLINAIEIEPNMIANAIKINDLVREPFHTFIHLRPRRMTNKGIRRENIPNKLFIID